MSIFYFILIILGIPYQRRKYETPHNPHHPKSRHSKTRKDQGQLDPKPDRGHPLQHKSGPTTRSALRGRRPGRLRKELPAPTAAPGAPAKLREDRDGGIHCVRLTRAMAVRVYSEKQYIVWTAV